MATNDGRRRGKRQELSRSDYREMVIQEARDLSDREDITLPEAIDILIESGYAGDDPVLLEWRDQWRRG
jgi:hypothetical protein